MSGGDPELVIPVLPWPLGALSGITLGWVTTLPGRREQARGVEGRAILT
jgi:hypothetical protein